MSGRGFGYSAPLAPWPPEDRPGGEHEVTCRTGVDTTPSWARGGRPRPRPDARAEEYTARVLGTRVIHVRSSGNAGAIDTERAHHGLIFCSPGSISWGSEKVLRADSREFVVDSPISNQRRVLAVERGPESPGKRHRREGPRPARRTRCGSSCGGRVKSERVRSARGTAVPRRRTVPRRGGRGPHRFSPRIRRGRRAWRASPPSRGGC